MSKIELPDDNTLNLEGRENRPLCPVCESYLDSAEPEYEMRRLNPDTRWFWCDNCQGHLGYHRMRKAWKVDQIDLYESPAFRAFFNIPDGE